VYLYTEILISKGIRPAVFTAVKKFPLQNLESMPEKNNPGKNQHKNYQNVPQKASN